MGKEDLRALHPQSQFVPGQDDFRVVWNLFQNSYLAQRLHQISLASHRGLQPIVKSTKVSLEFRQGHVGGYVSSRQRETL